LSRRKPIVVVGSINLDLVAVADRIPVIGETVFGTDFQIHPGGKGANQAVSVSRLGYPVQMIGRLGDDAFGVQLRKHLVISGVDIAGIATSEGPSGVAVIEVSAKGENSIVVAQGANAKLTPEDIDHNLPIIREAGLVLTQLEIPLETVEHLSSVCARQGVPLVFDPAPARDLPARIFSKIAWFTPNETEAAFYAVNGHLEREGNPSEIAAALLAKGCRGVVLKMGSRGLCFATRDQPPELLPAFPVKAVDTTAAGDCFNGAFAVGLMSGKNARDSSIFAAGAAAISVTRAGAQPSMPSMAELQSFINEYGAVES